MSTDKTWQMQSGSSDETEKIGEDIGAKLKGGEVIELVSDLGGGKTTMVRGIAKGFGSINKVSSPTFTVSKEYVSGNKRIVHYDFYRLNDPGVMEFELYETLSDPSAVAIIEWADIVHDILPKNRLTINIKSDGDTSRKIELKYTPELSYLADHS